MNTKDPLTLVDKTAALMEQFERRCSEMERQQRHLALPNGPGRCRPPMRRVSSVARMAIDADGMREFVSARCRPFYGRVARACAPPLALARAKLAQCSLRSQC